MEARIVRGMRGSLEWRGVVDSEGDAKGERTWRGLVTKSSRRGCVAVSVTEWKSTGDGMETWGTGDWSRRELVPCARLTVRALEGIVSRLAPWMREEVATRRRAIAAEVAAANPAPVVPVAVHDAGAFGSFAAAAEAVGVRVIGAGGRSDG